MSTFPTEQDKKQFEERARSGQFTAEDLDAFYKNPRLWRPLSSDLPAPEDAQTFWQMVWDDLALEIGGRIIVPPVPRLTPKQRKSISKFRLLLIYIPALTEDRYPESFVKPEWGSFDEIERKPLVGKWVAVETVAVPDRKTHVEYQNDLMMTAVGLHSRFRVSWDDLHDGLLEAIATTTGMPRKGTLLPSVEEYNFVANLFNWLREHRNMDLPNIGLVWCLELCENHATSYDRPAGDFVNIDGLNFNNCRPGGYAAVGDVRGGGIVSPNCRWWDIGFRVLFVL